MNRPRKFYFEINANKLKSRILFPGPLSGQYLQKLKISPRSQNCRAMLHLSTHLSSITVCAFKHDCLSPRRGFASYEA